MSRRLQDLFWDLDLTSTEQLVAQRLAWHADDATGRCWPGIASLCAKTGLGERAVQKSIQALKAAGHITRAESRGVGVVYFVHPRTTCAPTTPEPAEDERAIDQEGEAEPPSDVRPRTSNTPAPGAPTPARRAPKQVKNPSDDDGNAGDALTPEARITGQRGRRLDSDWKPTKPLPEAIVKVVAGWPPGRLNEKLDEFRDFWVADAGQRATKLDWDRTWWNRLREIIDRDRRRREREQRQNGQRHRDDRTNAGPRNEMVRAVAADLARRDARGEFTLDG